jgi:hypothetical protein
MSDREFENYLALLTRLLRLGDTQRQQIAGELRAHLEDRLDELLAQGVSREDAVRLALEEFGDAAGLAAEFASLSRNRRRRWLMRLTTYSVAATVLLAVGIVTFWPGRNAGPGVAEIIAQEAPPPAKAADPFAGPARPKVEAKPSAAGTLDRKLSQPTNVDFVEQPLRDVILYLSEQHAIPIVLKTKKLEEAGVKPDAPITISLKGVRLSTALELMLDELGLTYVDKEEVLLITTLDDAKATLAIRVYECRDLLALAAPAGPVGGAAAPGVGFGSADGGYGGGMLMPHNVHAAQLMNLIMTNVDQQSWSQTGGAGSISEYNGLIVVTQTAQTHKKIERVLEMLREAAGLDPAKAGKVVK